MFKLVAIHSMIHQDFDISTKVIKDVDHQQDSTSLYSSLWVVDSLKLTVALLCNDWLFLQIMRSPLPVDITYPVWNTTSSLNCQNIFLGKSQYIPLRSLDFPWDRNRQLIPQTVEARVALLTTSVTTCAWFVCLLEGKGGGSSLKLFLEIPFAISRYRIRRFSGHSGTSIILNNTQ